MNFDDAHQSKKNLNANVSEITRANFDHFWSLDKLHFEKIPNVNFPYFGFEMYLKSIILMPNSVYTGLCHYLYGSRFNI